MTRVRVYMACSFDGFRGGPGGDLSWLDAERDVVGDLPPDERAVSFDAFLSDVGCLIMGRTTYDKVKSFGVWPYGTTPVLVATRRPLEPLAPTVERTEGSIDDLVSRAKALAGGRDVYVDGGDLVRQALASGLVDEMIITVVPIVLGRGVRLFGDDAERVMLQFSAPRAMSRGMLQLTASVKRSGVDS